MITQIVICILMAAGILLFAWTIAAVLILPAKDDCVVLAASGDAEDLQQRVRAYSFLCNSGMARMRIVIVDCGLSPKGLQTVQRLRRMDTQIVCCSETSLPEVWKTERSV